MEMLFGQVWDLEVMLLRLSRNETEQGSLVKWCILCVPFSRIRHP